MPEWKSEIRNRLFSLRLDPAHEDGIVEELAGHLEDRYQEMLARGASYEQAHVAALGELSDGQLLVRELRRLERQLGTETLVLGARRMNMLGNLWQDLRFGLRLIRKNPGFSAVVVLTLAIGIGANTAIFSVVNAVMLKSLPFKDPDRLVRLNESNPERGWPTFSVSHPTFLDWRDRNQSFAALAATAGGSANLGAAGEIEVVRISAVTADFLTVLGTTPLMGRNFLPEEDKPTGNTKVVLLTYGSWQKRFGRDPEIVGRTIALNDSSFTVVGVLPESFAWGSSNLELLVPLAPDPQRSRADHRLLVIGKLKEGVSREQAFADLNTIAAQLAEQYPASNKGWLVSGEGFYDWFVPEPIRRSLLLFLGAVGVVLLIACSNVANLMLARAAARQKEISIRIALGAGRSRIGSQLLVEALSLAFIAGITGLGLAWLVTKALKSMNPANLPRLDEISMDWRVLGFSLLISLLTGVLFGLAPALHAARTNLAEMLKEGGRSITGGKVRQRIRSILVTAEVALSVALLISAGLLLRSFWRLQSVDPGFRPGQLLTARINLPRSRYQDNPRAWLFYKRLIEETSALPGIQSVGLTSGVPMSSGGNTAGEVQVEGRPPAPDGSKPSADWRIVSPGYFRTMGIPLRGREFDDRDGGDSQPTTIISEEMARRFWPDEDPIGKSVVLVSFDDKPFTIIGVAGNVRTVGLESDANPMSYAATAFAATWNPMNLVIRTSVEPTAPVSALRSTLAAIDPNVPLYEIRTVDELVSDTLGSRRFTMFLLGSFSAAALVLACVGLFGVMAYLVSQRTHEIGVRLALGARPGDVFRLIIGRGMTLAAVGSSLGLAGAWVFGRFVESLLYQITPSDPITLASAPVLLMAVALLACYVPARRAMRVDPMVALRED